MGHITIKRPVERSQFGYQNPAPSRPGVMRNEGPLTQVGEIRNGIQAQYLLDPSTHFSLRTPHKDLNYLQFAKAKNLNLRQSDHDQSFAQLNKQQQLANEKMARKGQAAFINHVINYVKNAERHGKKAVSMDIAETLDSFRQYRQKGSFDPHDHTRNLAMWLQHMMKGDHVNAHVVVGNAIITGLRAAGYKNAKIETKYHKKTINIPSDQTTTMNASAFKSRPKTQLITIPYNVVSVSTQCAKTPHLDNLNPRTQSVIRNKIPSWIGSIFDS